MSGSSGRMCRRSALQLVITAVLGALVGCQQPNAEPAGGIAKIFQKPAPQPAAPAPQDVWPPRAIWVPRQAWTDPGQIAAMMENCKRAGLNTVLFQVRGNGTALYHSSIEPFASDLYRGGAVPNFDPLEVACREAHARGIALHAWVNVMPAWRGDTPPTDARQLYNAHPDWFWYDQRGRRQPLGNFYVSLNPCLPQVRQYLLSVFQEIVSRYPVDGLHLDYIRFPMEESPRGSDYPYDQTTLALFKKDTGKSPAQARDAWGQWRTRQVSELVRQIRIMTKRVRPQVRLTAACGPRFDRWRADYHQDGPTWLRYRYVDCVFVMNYNDNVQTFKQIQIDWMQAAPGTMVVPGLGIYSQNAETTLRELALAHEWQMGFALFSSNALFGPEPRNQQRLAAIRPALLNMQGRSPI